MRYLLTILVFFSLKLQAHPVIYQDGIALSSSNMESYGENYLMYSYTNTWAAGLAQYRFSQDKQHTEIGLLKLNHLLWRQNSEDSHANIYLHGGIGKAARETYMAGIETDWETRKLFTSFKHFEFHTPGLMDRTVTQARIGFAPILTDFKDLQTWVMLQGMYTPEVDATVMVTPLLRFFYHNVLWEMGSSLRGEWMFNFMVHY